MSADEKSRGRKKMDNQGVGEFELISRLRGKQGRAADNALVLDIGDDAAALSPRPGFLTLVTCDSQIEGTHFRIETAPPRDIGHKIAAVNLSDIAAMGGEPRFAVVSLAVPPSVRSDFLVEVYAGASALLDQHGARIIGGNTAATLGPLVLDMTLMGEVSPGAMLRRSGAEAGDIICVSGEIGGSRAGLAVLSGRSADLSPEMAASAIGAHRVPIPRIAVGRLLGVSGHVTACMDISDGLAGDAAHLARASGVRLRIDVERLPIAAPARAVAVGLGEAPDIFACRGGEDYELLFTARPSGFEPLRAAVLQGTGVSVTAVGEVQRGEGVLFCRDGRPLSVPLRGYDHLDAAFSD